MAKCGQTMGQHEGRGTFRSQPPTTESNMGAPSTALYNLWPDFRRETNRLELPAVKVIACSLAVRVVGRAKFASCTAVAVTLLSLLAATAGAATAQQLQPNPPQRGAPEVTALGFDPATLPPIESIDAQTDITVFLQNGVPEKLRLAVLRRAWTVDPAIRDFKGPQENDWNFNDPNGVPGFGELGPEVDVKRMVAEILGEAPRLTLARWSAQAK
jgi:hypothetical protein